MVKGFIESRIEKLEQENAELKAEKEKLKDEIRVLVAEYDD